MVTLHVRNIGDISCPAGEWAGRPGSRQWIEGIAILPQHGIEPDEIEYCVTPSTSETSEWVRGGTFCGTRGLSVPLTGFCLRLRGSAAGRVTCSYRATFVDGTAAGPMPAGTICKSQTGASLEALQIGFQAASQQPPSRDAGGGRELMASNERLLRQAQAGQYDFIDLGTRDGSGFVVGSQMGGVRGLGIDSVPALVRQNLDAGRDVICADVTALGVMNLQVKFGVCHHMLQHLSSIHELGHVVGALARNCTDFLLIAGPCFDHEDYLYRCGLKAFHSAVPAHTCRFKTFDLMRVLHDLGQQRYALGVSLPIRDSDSEFIVGADAPNEIWRWEALRALPRPRVTFDPLLYRDIVCVVALNDAVDPVAKLRSYSFAQQQVDKIVHVASW
jgi:hypothetical protein